MEVVTEEDEAGFATVQCAVDRKEQEVQQMVAMTEQCKVEILKVSWSVSTVECAPCLPFSPFLSRVHNTYVMH